VFTDLHDYDRFGGFYFAAGGRQVYIGTWEYSYIEHHPAKLARRLRENEAVLAGRTPPSRLEDARGRPAYFAVRERDARAHDGWRLLYRNRAYALYELPARAAGAARAAAGRVQPRSRPRNS
jgi:hypothetical protein